MSDNNALTLSTPQSELENKLIEENDIEQMKNIIELFNLNIKKKDIVRANKLSDIQDKISDQIAKRIDNRADEFSNADLLNYLKVVQDIINRSDNSLDSIKTPSIQINQQNNVNIDVAGAHQFNKESRDKITDAVQAILAKYDSLQKVEIASESDELEEVIDG